MPVIQVWASNHPKLKKGEEYRLIIRSSGLTFKLLQGDDPLDTLLSLAVPPEEVTTVEVREKKNEMYLRFEFVEGHNTHHADLLSQEIPPTVLGRKIRQLVDPNFDEDEEENLLPPTGNGTEASFMAALERFVTTSQQQVLAGLRGGLGLSVSIVQKGIGTLKVGLGQLVKLSTPLTRPFGRKKKREVPEQVTAPPLDLTERSVTVNKTTLTYVDSAPLERQEGHSEEQVQTIGQPPELPPAKTILFVHGIGLGWKVWEPYLQAFHPTHRVVAYDLRGHGGSQKDGKNYKAKDYVKDLEGLVEELGLVGGGKELTLVTHSFTGILLLHELDKKQLLADRLVLLSASDRIDESLANVARNLPPTQMWGTLKKAGRGKVKAFLFAPGTSEGTKEELVNQFYATDHTVLRETVKNFTDKKYVRGLGRKDYERLDLPILVVVGLKDAVFPPPLLEHLEQLPQGTIRVVEDANHMLPYEAPELVVGELRQWLDRLG